LAGRDAADTLRKLGDVADGLGQAIGRPAEILPMSSYRAMIDAQQLGRIDGGFYSAAAYALAQSACECLEPLVAPAASDGTNAYYAILVTASDADIDGLAGLKGKSVAVAAADSVGGRRLPLAALLAEGIDVETFFSEIRDAGSARQAVRLMLAGEVDAAFAWTSLSGEIAAGYSRGTLTDLVAADAIDMSEVLLVWRSPAITHGPVALGASVTDPEKQAIEGYLLGLEQSDPAAYDALNPYYAGGYVPVNQEDYSGIALLAEEDVDAIRIAGPDAGPPIGDLRLQ
jgi:phosphonate transport system substrate-binding protein